MFSVMNLTETPTFASTKPVEWAMQAPGLVAGPMRERNMDVMPDGRLVVIARHSGETTKGEILVVEHWFDELNARVTVK
jgi:hypothetical protein